MKEDCAADAGRFCAGVLISEFPVQNLKLNFDSEWKFFEALESVGGVNGGL